MFYYNKWLFCFIMVFCIFSFCLSNLCDIPINHSCSNSCSGSSCPRKLIQGFHETNGTSKLKGCIGNGVLSGNSYSENHIIFSDSHHDANKIYLTFVKAYSTLFSNFSTMKIMYNFLLLSPTKTKWIVTSPNLPRSQYQFIVSRGSTLLNSSTGNVVNSITADIKLKTYHGYWCAPEQIHDWFCTKFLKLNKGNCNKNLTSFINATAINSLRLLVGPEKLPYQNAHQCNFSDSLSKLNGFTNKLAGLSLSPIKRLNLCTRHTMSNHENLVFIVDIVGNSTSRRSIELHLEGIMLVARKANVVIVLKSTFPVVWKPKIDNTKPIHFNLIFLITGQSTVVLPYSNGSFQDNLSDNIVILQTSLSNQGKELLRKISRALNISPNSFRVLSYSQLMGTPNLITVIVKESGIFSEVDDTLLRWLHRSIHVTADKGAFLKLPCLWMNELLINPSAVEFGNGSCKMHNHNNSVYVSDLTQCGLKMSSRKKFHFEITINGHQKSLLYFLPKTVKDSTVTVYKDARKTSQVLSPQPISENSSTFYVEVRFSSFERDGIFSKLDQCFLRSRQDSFEIPLILNSCYVTNQTELLVFHHTSPDTLFFSLRVDTLLKRERGNVYDLVCILSRCFEADKLTRLSSILPQCPSRYDSPCLSTSPVQTNPFNETILAASFRVPTAYEIEVAGVKDLFAVLIILIILIFCGISAVLGFCIYKRGKCRRAFNNKTRLNGRSNPPATLNNRIDMYAMGTVQERDKSSADLCVIGSSSNHVIAGRPLLKKPVGRKRFFFWASKQQNGDHNQIHESSIVPFVFPDSKSNSSTDSGVGQDESPTLSDHLSPVSLPRQAYLSGSLL